MLHHHSPLVTGNLATPGRLTFELLVLLKISSHWSVKCITYLVNNQELVKLLVEVIVLTVDRMISH